MVDRRTQGLLGLGSILGVLALVGVVYPSPGKWVKAGQTTYWDVYADPTWYATNSGLLPPLLPYLDSYIARIKADLGYDVFPLPTGQPRLVLVLDPVMGVGSAMAGTVDFGLGVTIGEDCVLGDAFWYYVLTLHETVNIWTGLLAGGWPFADGSSMWAGTSPFPCFCEIPILSELGYSAMSTADAARLQAENPSGYVGVQLFLNIKATYGWAAFQKFFALVRSNGITDWTVYAEPLRTAILAWLFTKTTGVDQLANFNTATYPDSGQTVPLTAYQQAQALFP